jgi:hypothetical protein
LLGVFPVRSWAATSQPNTLVSELPIPSEGGVVTSAGPGAGALKMTEGTGTESLLGGV